MSSCAELQLESDTTDGNNNNNDNDMEEQEECASDNSKNGVEALKQMKQEILSDGAEDEQSDPALSHVHEEEEAAGQESQLRLRVIAPSICTSVSSSSSQMMADAGAHETLQKHPGFGIENGTLELVQVVRKEWIHPQKLPLPTASSKKAPIIMEFVRHWSALRLRPHPSESLPRGKAEMGQDQSLLKNYEPRFSVGEQTFPSEIMTPSFFDPRVAVEDAHAFLVTTHLRFALGMVEPLFCRLVIYDISLGCRVTEEFSYSIPGAVDLNGNISKAPSLLSSVRVPQALFYALPNHLPQHLYIVLKVSKVLVGDGEGATTPYCSPEKLTSESEQQKLVEKAADCFRRLGRYRQPIAWGAIALMEGCNRPMTLYRQRIAMSDEQRLPLIPEAVRGALKEKVVPSVCEFDLERIDDQRLAESKFQFYQKSEPSEKCSDFTPISTYPGYP